MKLHGIITLLTYLMIMVTGTVSADLHDGLVAHYPFNGNANDESGNGNHGTVNGAALTSDRFGNVDSAYIFDGVDDIILIDDDPSLEPSTALTVSAWVKSTGNWSDDNYISKDAKIGSVSNGYLLRSGEPENELNFYAGGKGTKSGVPVDVWVHVAGVYVAGIRVTIYIDGDQMAEKTVGIPSSITYGTGKLGIGGPYDSSSLFFNGTVDDIRIYNRALTASEIQELYRETISNVYSGDGHSLDAADGDPTDAVFVDNEGNVGIGTMNPGIYRLAVNGTIKSREVVVETTGWSDFVFRDDYALMPLGRLEEYIRSNRHLPQIPSAEDVTVNGIKIGNMQSRLLQKIEELTLYMIDLEKKTERFKEENRVLRNENDLIKTRLNILEKGMM